MLEAAPQQKRRSGKGMMNEKQKTANATIYEKILNGLSFSTFLLVLGITSMHRIEQRKPMANVNDV